MIKVYNKTDEVYYQIVIKIVIQASKVLTSHIKIDPRKHEPTPGLEVRTGFLALSADAIRHDGTDEAGNKAIFLWLACLDPRSVRTFVLQNKCPHMPPVSEQPQAFITVASFDQEPASVLQSVESGEVAISFKPPKNVVIESIHLLMKRAQ